MVAPRVGSSQKSACSLLCCQPGVLRQLGSDACTPSEARAGYTEVSRWLIKTGDSQPSLLLSSTFFFPSRYLCLTFCFTLGPFLQHASRERPRSHAGAPLPAVLRKCFSSPALGVLAAAFPLLLLQAVEEKTILTPC